MKKLSIFLSLAIAVVILSFTFIREGGIKGFVNPAEAATSVIAISGTDTLSAEVLNGVFSIPAKKGTYTLWFKARPPYKDTSVSDVPVIDSATTDVGEVKMMQ